MAFHQKRKHSFLKRDSNNTAAVDSFSNQLMVYLLLFIIVLSMVAVQKKTEGDGDPSMGPLKIELAWKDGPIDMDLWLRAPQIEKPIGFSNPNSKDCNLLRDDLGTQADPLSINYEDIICRATVPGEYIINAKAFSIPDNETDVQVHMLLTLKKSPGEMGVRYERTVTFSKLREERTLMRFTLDDERNIIEDSIHDFFRSIHE